MMKKAIIFDFDGVILESANIKTEAFREVVKGYDKEVEKEFMSYHMKHMGISRHIKFRYLFEEILKETKTEKKEFFLVKSFEKIINERIFNCPFVPGALEFLRLNYNKLDLFVASGTPEEELRCIIDKRNISKYFREVFGSPKTKTEVIDIVKKKYSFNNEELIFVGDALTDMLAANERNIMFVGKSSNENKNIFQNIEYKIDDLMQLQKLVNVC